MTEATRRTTKLGVLLATLIVALTLAFSSAAWANVNTADEGPVDYGEHGAVRNGQPTSSNNFIPWIVTPIFPDN